MRGDGSIGRVASVVLADETGTLRASFWDGAADIAEKLKVGDILSVRNAYARAGLGGRPEVQVGKAAVVEINPPGVEVAAVGPSRLKIFELEPNLTSVEVVGRVVEVGDKREFTRNDGSRGKLASLVIGDESGTARVTLWNEHADEVDSMKVGDVVKLVDAYTTLGLLGQPELQLGRQGKVELNPMADLPTVDAIGAIARTGKRVEISDLDKEGMQVQALGTVVKVFHRRPVFDVCPECGGTLGGADTSSICDRCGKAVTPEHRVVISMILDDGTGSIRAVLFGETAERLLGVGSQDVFEMLKSKPDIAVFYEDLKLVGKELLVSGTTRRDRYFDQLELRVSDVQIADPLREADALLKRLKEMA
jgi:replication factor A1